MNTSYPINELPTSNSIGHSFVLLLAGVGAAAVCFVGYKFWPPILNSYFPTSDCAVNRHYESESELQAAFTHAIERSDKHWLFELGYIYDQGNGREVANTLYPMSGIDAKLKAFTYYTLAEKYGSNCARVAKKKMLAAMSDSDVSIVLLAGKETAQNWDESVKKRAGEELAKNSAEPDPAADRDAQRRKDMNMLMNAVYQYTIDRKGVMPREIPTGTPIEICATEGPKCAGLVDLGQYLLHPYIVSMPVDPSHSDPIHSGYMIERIGEIQLRLTSKYNEKEEIVVERK